MAANDQARFHDLPLLAAHGQRRHFATGETIFAEGERAAEMYVLVEGSITIVRDGSELDHLQARTVLGEMALVDAGQRSATAVAATDCAIIAIDRENFRVILRDYPDFATDIMAVMTARLRRLTDQEMQRQRLEHELQIGHDIQLSLLPEGDPETAAWRIASHYQAARQVGGDFYDYVVLPDAPEDLTILVADVTGKGVPAAMFMAVARTMLHTETLDGTGPARTLERVNDLVVSDNRTPLFLSALSVHLSGADGRATFASAGHEAPILLPRTSGEARYLPLHGLVLGAFPHVRYAEEQVVMAPGDVMLLYTDGVTEARDSAGRFFGEERLLATVEAGRGQAPGGLVERVVTAVSEFRGGAPQTDDLTIVAVERLIP